MVHRISGLALACFLPLHFLALGLAIDGEARLDGFLKWTANPLVKLAETVPGVPAGGAHAGRHPRAGDREPALARGAEAAGLLAGGAAIAIAALFLIRAVA